MMKHLLETIALLGAALLPAALAVACGPAEKVACPLLDCAFEGDEGMHVTIASATERFAADVPVTIEVCAEELCTEVVLRLEGMDFVCLSEDIRAECKLTDSGAAEIEYTVKLPDRNEASVRVSVRNAAGDGLYEETKSVQIDETGTTDKLDCPQVCREGSVTFAPSPSSP